MTGYRSQPFDPDQHDTVAFDTQRLIQKIINVAAALTTCPGITASPQTLERRTPLARSPVGDGGGSVAQSGPSVRPTHGA